MRNQVFKQNVADSQMDVALDALGKSIAQCTEKGEQHITPIPGLLLFRRDEPTEPISSEVNRNYKRPFSTDDNVSRWR
jgi:hypothetical protein